MIPAGVNELPPLLNQASREETNCPEGVKPSAKRSSVPVRANAGHPDSLTSWQGRRASQRKCPERQAFSVKTDHATGGRGWQSGAEAECFPRGNGGNKIPRVALPR